MSLKFQLFFFHDPFDAPPRLNFEATWSFAKGKNDAATTAGRCPAPENAIKEIANPLSVKGYDALRHADYPLRPTDGAVFRGQR